MALTGDMNKRRNPPTEGDSREQRLRAALRENLARRKAQGRARAAEDANRAEQTQTGAPQDDPDDRQER